VPEVLGGDPCQVLRTIELVGLWREAAEQFLHLKCYTMTLGGQAILSRQWHRVILKTKAQMVTELNPCISLEDRWAQIE